MIYSEKEEKLNIWSHGLGVIFSLFGTILLLYKAAGSTSIIASIIYGGSMILLYSASTLYHKEKNPIKRAKLRIFDHIAIYFLIAGTYTPFAMITLPDQIGMIILSVIWGIAVAGFILKLFFTGRFHFLSVALYVGMGWIGVFAVNPLRENLQQEGIMLILYGGIAYTIGAIIYSIKRIPFNHAIFHFFVLLGSLFHFLSIYKYVL